MESGYCTACAGMEHFDNPRVAREAYRQSTDNLKSIEGLIAVISLCLIAFGLGYAMGSKDGNKPQK